ncbi:helix-turn-helix domain-containing protein [Candidatus Nanosalina sp. VS9-1]|uniref:helix-turn-helix domain-containing protein n=1 Tax=Candidatus Nanosalina sp. VS9-1 TaxID=3388566 RepID=UPI0039DF5234
MKLFRGNETVDSQELDEEKLKALSDDTRRKIIELLAEEEMYPREVARELGLEKQKIYYHFNKLEDSGLIEQTDEKKVSGGSATLYAASAPSYVFDTGASGEENFRPVIDAKAESFLRPFIRNGEVRGRIVVGSPEQHGPDKVQARDGHLAGEIGLEVGKFGEADGKNVFLDTEIVRDSLFEDSMILIGGVLTNTITRRFNEAFPVSFEGENFPYREISTPETSYSEDAIGVVAKTTNPENEDEAVFLVAGVRNSGTEAAVLAFKNLESLVDNYSEGDFYRVVQGLDMNGDGEIDDYEVIE